MKIPIKVYEEIDIGIDGGSLIQQMLQHDECHVTNKDGIAYLIYYI